MKELNPIAVNLWIACAGAGYLIGDIRGAVWGLTISTGISFLLSLFLT